MGQVSASEANRLPGATHRLVTHPDQIALLARDLGFARGARTRIELRLPDASEADNRRLAEIINGHLSACGCGQGRISGVVTMIGYVALCATGVISVRTLGIGNTVLLYFACAAVAMLVGKAFALWRARRALVALAARLQSSTNPAATVRGG